MNDYRSNDRSRDRRGSDRGGYGGGGRSFGGGRDSDRPSMHDAVCDDCGKDCQVPFRPTSGKPIFCSDCFDKKGGREGRPDRGSGRRSFGDKDRGRSPQGGQGMSQLSEKIEALGTKLDTIIDLLSPGTKTKRAKSKKVEEAPVVTLVEEKDADLEAEHKPKKKAKSKKDSTPKVEPETEEEPQVEEASPPTE